MAHRSFVDPMGQEWEVWDVFPQRADRRVTADRRAGGGGGAQAGPPAAVERRRGERRSPTDRRATARRPSQLPAIYSDGWLCFERIGEKRRLIPVPGGWDRLTDSELARLLDSAQPVRAATRVG